MDFVSRVAIMILFNLIIIYFQFISVGTFGLLQYVCNRVRVRVVFKV